MKFDKYNFAPEIKRNLEELGFKRPTDIQYKSIPPILKGEDVLAIAQTGTGKTAAFALPVIQLLLSRKKVKAEDGVRCLVMVPTHELAIQISEVFEQLGQDTRLKIVCIYGGVEQAPQIEKLGKGADILIATPGRMFDLASQGFLKLGQVEILILDEADHMLDLGFIHDIRQLTHMIPRKHQTLFFSATINEHIKDLAYSLVQKPIRIQLSPKDPVSKNVNHSVAFIEMDDKRFFLERLVKENDKSKILVFVRTKIRAERVCKALERVGIKSLTIHGNKDQGDRMEAMGQFKQGKVKVMIATDVSARGIDIPDVEYVVNYDLPDDAENYVHRVGRTGRGTNKGTALSFCSSDEKEMLEVIEKFLDKKITIMEIDKANYAGIVELSDEAEHDWRSLIKEATELEQKAKKKKKK
ncbi:MAG: DEAD/DEAH box helicase [Bacteroidota bacterium]|nr:DEAD/DEAH box helicase [Bacteroidota bacterium]